MGGTVRKCAATLLSVVLLVVAGSAWPMETLTDLEMAAISGGTAPCTNYITPDCFAFSGCPPGSYTKWDEVKKTVMEFGAETGYTVLMSTVESPCYVKRVYQYADCVGMPAASTPHGTYAEIFAVRGPCPPGD